MLFSSKCPQRDSSVAFLIHSTVMWAKAGITTSQQSRIMEVTAYTLLCTNEITAAKQCNKTYHKETFVLLDKAEEAIMSRAVFTKFPLVRNSNCLPSSWGCRRRSTWTARGWGMMQMKHRGSQADSQIACCHLIGRRSCRHLAQEIQ